MKPYERLIRYAKIHTASDDTSQSSPTTSRQFDLAKLLQEELWALGIQDARIDEFCDVYGSLPATAGYESAPCLGFIAHIDTVPDFSGENVKPRVIENYDGGDVVLGDSGRVLRVAEFPHLPSLAGRTLIVTDGTTVLGADDKAGISEIMSLIEWLTDEHIPHGRLAFAFTPDEEVGHGTDHFDVSGFGAEFAYTVDGGAEGEIEYENFNAASAAFDISGFNVHPGTAKNTMKNAQLIAMEINALLPGGETPGQTEGYEGFYHLCRMTGNVESAHLEYIVRDHSAELFEARLTTLHHIEKVINERYGAGTTRLTLKEQYRNMAEKIRPCFHLIENAEAAAKECGITPSVKPIRGGTDGAMLSYKGLPCPNLGTGGYAFHGPYEHITAEGMEFSTAMILSLVRRYSTFEKAR